MSNFSNLFSTTYTNSNLYTDARDLFVEKTEDPDLLKGIYGAGAYGYNSAAYTIGYGYDISKQTGSQIIDDFTDARIFTPSNIKGSGKYASLYESLQNYDNTNSTSLKEVDGKFAAAFNAANALTQAEASSLLDAESVRFEESVTNQANTFPSTGSTYALGNNSLHELLFSEDFNGGNIFGRTQASDIYR